MAIEAQEIDKGAVEGFYGRLTGPERDSVDRIILTVEDMAETYETDGLARFSEAPAFFGVYAIGSTISVDRVDEGAAAPNDIDLLVVHNAFYYESDESSRDVINATNGDRVIGAIAELFGEQGSSIQVFRGLKSLPDTDYRFGPDEKAMLRIDPPRGSEDHRSIDLVFIPAGAVVPSMKSLKKFEKRDVDNGGSPLGRLALIKLTVDPRRDIGTYYHPGGQVADRIRRMRLKEPTAHPSTP